MKTAEEIFEDEDEEDMSEEENNNDNNIPEIITFFKARVALDTLRKFLQQNDFSKKSLDMLSDIEKEMYASCPK